jgi:hypothetical protein
MCRAAALCVLAAVAVALAGCGGSGEAVPETVTVEGDEYGYDVPDELEGGVVSLRFVNTGDEPHEFALGRIEGDHTVGEALAALNENDGKVPWLESVSGVPLLSPGREVTVTRNLEAGRYALLCFFPSPGGEPHAELGMTGELEVAGTAEAALPEPDAVIVATGEGYDVPEIEAGTRTIELRNESGAEPSWYLYTAQPAKTADDFDAWIEGGQKGEPPLELHGLMQSFGTDESIFVTLELRAGTTYTLADDEGGLPEVSFTPR